MLFIPLSLDYRLVIIYGSDDAKDSHFISKLQHFLRPFVPQQNVDIYRSYLIGHFQRQELVANAAMVDHEQ